MAPLNLFRTIATSQRAWEKFSAGSLLDKGPLGLREREMRHIRGNDIENCPFALGHAIGASGARVLTTLLYALARRNATRGIAALCLGGGNGVALAVERL